MSLVSGYPPQAYHTGGISHEFYPYHAQAAPRGYQDHPGAVQPDTAYFQNWVLNGHQNTHPGHPDFGVNGGDCYGLGGAAPTDYVSMLGVMDSTGARLGVRVVKKKGTSNRKERRRTHSINSAFASLRGCIPNVPSDTKLSKIKTLRLATSYIAYLMDILNKDDPKLEEGGFKAEITKKIESREEKRKRETEEIAKSQGSTDKKNKGRTGWPQHVWASELNPNGEIKTESTSPDPEQIEEQHQQQQQQQH